VSHDTHQQDVLIKYSSSEVNVPNIIRSRVIFYSDNHLSVIAIINLIFSKIIFSIYLTCIIRANDT
jgi:hypothetical protein